MVLVKVSYFLKILFNPLHRLLTLSNISNAKYHNLMAQLNWFLKSFYLFRLWMISDSWLSIILKQFEENRWVFWSPPFPFLFFYLRNLWMNSNWFSVLFCSMKQKRKIPLISIVVKQWKKGNKKSSLLRQEWKTISEFLTVTILCNVSSMMIISEKNHRQLRVCEQNCSTLAMKTG